MKNKEELNALKEEVETVSKERHALSDDDLEKVSGGKEEQILGPTEKVYGYCDRWVQLDSSGKCTSYTVHCLPLCPYGFAFSDDGK